jgi:hypothetical protein
MPDKKKPEPKNNEDLVKSIEELKTEVKQLRELVNMLVDIIMNMEGEEVPEFDANFTGLDEVDRHNRFSM